MTQGGEYALHNEAGEAASLSNIGDSDWMFLDVCIIAI